MSKKVENTRTRRYNLFLNLLNIDTNKLATKAAKIKDAIILVINPMMI